MTKVVLGQGVEPTVSFWLETGPEEKVWLMAKHSNDDHRQCLAALTVTDGDCDFETRRLYSENLCHMLGIKVGETIDRITSVESERHAANASD